MSGFRYRTRMRNHAIAQQSPPGPPASTVLDMAGNSVLDMIGDYLLDMSA